MSATRPYSSCSAFRAIAVFALCAIVAGALHAQVTSGVTTSVTNTNVAVNELFLVTVELVGGEVGDVLLPQSDDVGFKPVPSFQASSHSFSIRNGQPFSATTRTLGYEAWAKREGRVSIPPLRAVIDGTEYASEPIELTVIAEGASPPPGQRTRRATQQPNRLSTSAPDLDDIALFEAKVDKNTVFQGEPIMLDLRVMVLASPNVTLLSRAQLERPDTEGFFAGPLQQYEEQEMRDGWPYNVTVVRQALFPTGVGEYMIGAAQWTAQLRAVTRQGLRPEQKLLQTEPILVRVKPLPPKPANFSGAVGQFDAHAGIKDQRLIQGVPTTLEFTVSGRGNPNAIVPPQYPDLDWAQIGDPEVETQHDDQDWPVMRKTFRFTITPLKAGTFTLPSFDFVFFHPGSEDYRTDTVPEMQLEVAASSEGEQLVVMGGSQAAQQREVRILSEDLLPLITVPTGLGTRQPPLLRALLFLLVPPALYLILYLILRRQRRFAQDPELARRHFARATAHKRLAHLGQSREPSEDLFRAVVGYLADKFNANETGMTSQDAHQLLETQGAPPEVRDQLMKVIRSCERRRYAGVELRQDEISALAQAAEAAIAKLEHWRG